MPGGDGLLGAALQGRDGKAMIALLLALPLAVLMHEAVK